MNTVWGKKIMNMDACLQKLLALSAATLVISGIAIGVYYVAELALSTTIKTGLKYAAAGSALAIVLVFATDFGVSWWKASKNKENFQKAITHTSTAITEISNQLSAL